MNTICNLVLIILSMSVTGLVLTLIWIMLKALFGRFLRSDIIYKMLKIVIISYFIPFEFLVFSFKFHFLEGTENYFYFFSNPMKLVLGSVFAIMMVMIIVEVCRWIKGNIKLKKSTRLRMPVKVDVNNIVNELCADMKIKKKFSVYQGFATASPFIYGFIKPEIYLTVDKLSEEDLRIALTHELFHYKQGDVFFKPLVSIMCCINWFNPLAWFVKKEFNLWSEVCCDYKCFTKGGYDIEEYFDAILRMATGLYEKYLGIISMAAGKSQLYKRTMLMIKYSKNKLNYTILTVIMTVTVVISFLSLYGTSYAAEYMYNYVYESTQTEVLEYDIKTEDGYIEHVVKNVNSNINSEPAAVEAFAEIDYYNDVA